jgi:hypothetical protein
MRRSEQVVKYAKSVMRKDSTRTELLQKTSKKFNISPNTVNTYFVREKFKTGRWFLTRYWEEVRSGKREIPDYIKPTKSLEILEFIKKKPRFPFEITKKFGYSTSFYRILKMNGLSIKKLRFKRVFLKKKKKKVNCIYYTPEQGIEVYGMLARMFGDDFDYHRKNLSKILGVNIHS